ncbi:nSTAND1 domain-containing NTPase [Mycolicibacterium neworleansense]|uniref:Putative regulatory protein n=1 Tax=Mycolicibacterium neworleansense TaxID=146018 RepID=A0A0H5RTK3_9MYCO|nr:TIR domain-containing protein [Mycolicibacterium neworleansense]MCV7361471.1 TIR domain-containing protein [Mycolicibacterium neworleansense]CRZ16822.1 putative regulatory protein [Mycolicibacterium neworleansense]
MANIFISHSSAASDSEWTDRIHGWMREDGHAVFLDHDRRDGIPVGDEWETRLYERLRWADAVVCVVTPAYLSSVWCAAEIGAARALGSELLPVRASSGELPDRLLKSTQHLDATRDPLEVRESLRSRLRVIDGGGGRGWPDGKSPYPGLRSFDLGEHLVFFGRVGEVTQLAQRLRSPERATASILAVVGPSGCGKSSLVRAGLLPRLATERLWLSVPPMMPGSDPMGSLARALAALAREHKIGIDLTSMRTQLASGGLKSLATDILIAADCDTQCKLLIVIDQFEELLTQTEPDDRAEFLDTIEPALGGPVQVLATLRPEFLDAITRDAQLSTLALVTHQVRPLDLAALRSVIEGPAKVAGLGFEPDLVTQLVADTASGDALPLLAFTLEQLADGAQRGDTLTHQRYVAIGGVQGALRRQADAALDEAVAKAGASRDEVIAALLALVTIDEDGRPTKRHVSFDDFSPTTAAHLEPFITRRLLSTERVGETTFITVAHEAFLANWAPLADEIEAEVTALRARRVVENAASDWVAGGRDERALLQGGQLTKAAVDTGARLLGSPRWWRGRRRLDTRVDLNREGHEFLEASIRSDQRRRHGTIMRVAAVIAVLCITAATAVVGFVQARAQRAEAQSTAREAIAARILNEAGGMLAQTRPGGDIRAFQELLAGHALAPNAVAGGLLEAATQRVTTVKIIDVGAPLWGLAFSPDGSRVSVGEGNSVRSFDARSGQPDGEPLQGHGDSVAGLAYSPDGARLATASKDHTVLLWDTGTRKILGGLLSGHTEPVNNVVFSPDGKRLASAGQDHTIRLRDTETGKPIGGPLTGHSASVNTVVFSPDGKRLASASDDHTIRLWNADTGQQVGPPLDGRQGAVLDVVFSPDGHRLAAGTYEQTVQVWDADTGTTVGTPWHGHTEPVGLVAYSPDGRLLASGSVDNKVQVWDAKTGQPLGPPLVGHTDAVRGMQFSPDGRMLATASTDGTLRLWNPTAGLPLTGHTDDVNRVTFSPDGKRIASASTDHTIRLWDADSGKQLGIPLTGHTETVLDVAFSPDGHRLASGSAYPESVVRLWDADTGNPIGTPLTGHTDAVFAVAYSPDGKRIASGSADRTIQLWDADTGRPLGAPLVGHADSVFSVAFSPDGNLLASASADDTVRLWEVDGGQPVAELKGHTNDVMGVAFSPDGKLLASASADQTVRLWDVESRQPAGDPLRGHAINANDVAFSPDGTLLATAGYRTVRVWDVNARQPVGQLTGHTDIIFGVAFSPDGTRVASASWDDTIRISPASGTSKMLCDKLSANMTHQQWKDWISSGLDYRTLCDNLPVPPD